MSPRHSKSPRARLRERALRALPVAFGVLEATVPQLAARWASALFSTPPPSTLSARALAFLSTGRRFHVPLGATQLAAWRWGADDAPRTAVLMHGWGGRASQMSAFVDPLVAQGLRVIALDGPAHGESGGKQSGLPLFAAALRALQRQVGPFHGLVGHSLGGAASALAMENGLRVERTVFIGAPSSPSEYADTFARRLRLGPATIGHMKALFEARYDLVWEQLSVPLMAAAMTTPLLVIQDEDDTDVPMADAEAIAAAWPGARLMITRGFGHRKVLRAASVVEAVRAFICAGSMREAACLTAHRTPPHEGAASPR